MRKHDQTGYGFKNGQLVHVSEVPRGLACGCICASCHLELIAKKGTKRKHHFAHKINSHCDGGVETTLHLLAKEIFQEINQFTIPAYHFHKEKKIKSGIEISHDKLVVKGGEISIDEAHIECVAQGFTPDIVVTSNRKKLLIEIAVTHLVDRKKMRHIRKYGLPAIEIRLDWNDALLTKSELSKKLRVDVECKHWLFHPSQKEAEAEFFAKLRNAIRAMKKPRLDTPIQSVDRPAKWIPTENATGYDWLAFEKAGKEFFRKHGRWPSMDECLRLWPWMRKPS